MKLKKILLTGLVALMAMSSYAQLSQRSNDPSNFKFGTRPESGDWGINLQLYSVGATNFKNYFQDLPIINLQYYYESDLALRFGLRASKHKTIFSGESNNNLNNPNNISEMKYKTSDREYMIYLGAEKHFSPTNLLDVYVGGQIPIGYSSNVVQNDADYLNNRGKNHSLVRNSALLYGIEGFIGLQAFVADLPIAVGAEWGFAGYGKLFNTIYHKIETNNTTTEFYTTNEDMSGTQYTSLNSRKFDMENMVRFRISYYFK